MTEQAKSARAQGLRRSLLWWILTITLAMALVGAVVITSVIYRAEPILKERVVETLSAHFHGSVQLGEFHVSIKNGLQVTGAGFDNLRAERSQSSRTWSSAPDRDWAVSIWYRYAEPVSHSDAGTARVRGSPETEYPAQGGTASQS